MRLARARPRDARPLAAILHGWTAETGWMPRIHTAEETAGLLRRLIRTCDVDTVRGWRGPVGFLARDGAVIHALYLAPGARGRGWGRRLLDRAKARAPRLTLWAFQANGRALAFYAREGFVEVERSDGAGNDEKLPDVRLEWRRARA